jgi:hypothetical protein
VGAGRFVIPFAISRAPPSTIHAGYINTGGCMQHKAKLILAKCAITGLVAFLSAKTALAGDVGVAVNVNAPGLYGQISIGGGLPEPELLLPRPTIVVPAQVVVPGPPPEALYLHVPPGYERHWERHCREYNACERPVYFVSDRWYHDVYTPHYISHREEEHRGDERRGEERRDAEHRHDGEHDRRNEHEHERYDHEHEHDHDRDHERDHDRDHER